MGEKEGNMGFYVETCIFGTGGKQFKNILT